MAKQYTITKEESFTEFFVDEGKVSGTLYTVILENGDVCEQHTYFVRDDQNCEDVLKEAVGVLEKDTSEEKTAEESAAAEPVTVD